MAEETGKQAIEVPEDLRATLAKGIIENVVGFARERGIGNFREAWALMLEEDAQSQRDDVSSAYPPHGASRRRDR